MGSMNILTPLAFENFKMLYTPDAPWIPKSLTPSLTDSICFLNHLESKSGFVWLPVKEILRFYIFPEVNCLSTGLEIVSDMIPYN